MAYLGISYNYTDWQEAFRVIEKAEEDTVAAITSIRKLSANAINSAPSSQSSTSSISHTPWPALPQLEKLKNSITKQVEELQRRGQIWGTALSLEEMLNPIEEDVVGEMGFEFPGGDKNIIARVI